ncbi:MAG: sugar ABC transporter permease [Trueperaceae bacterium]|nr:sugar ABC transporter permease [Trueperaceae bacterium]
MAVLSSSTPSSTKAKALSGRKVREWLTGYLFILPAFLIIGIFGLFPIGYALYMSLYRWRVRKSGFIGFDNYEKLLGSPWGALAFVGGLLLIVLAHWLWVDAFKVNKNYRLGRLLGALVLLGAGVIMALGWNSMLLQGSRDTETFLHALVRTVFYAFGSIPLQIVFSLLLASLLYQKIRGQELFRMIFFLPYVMPVVATSVVFRSIFSQREESIANQIITALGLPAQRWLFEAKPILEVMFGERITQFNSWLSSTGVSWQLEGLWLGPSLALIVLILFGIWTYSGYNVVIFLAGLGNIPKQLYEAAEIDGANGIQKFWNITVPLLSPVTFYLTVLGFIGALQAFTQLYVMRQPFARDSLDTASVVIFDTFYKSNNFSLAATQSIVLFVLILIITLLQNRIMGRRVFDA